MMSTWCWQCQQEESCRCVWAPRSKFAVLILSHQCNINFNSSTSVIKVWCNDVIKMTHVWAPVSNSNIKLDVFRRDSKRMCLCGCVSSFVSQCWKGKWTKQSDFILKLKRVLYTVRNISKSSSKLFKLVQFSFQNHSSTVTYCWFIKDNICQCQYWTVTLAELKSSSKYQQIIVRVLLKLNK